MASQIQAPRVNGFSVLMDAENRIAESVEIPRMTEPASEEAKTGVSMRDMLRSMLAEELGAMRQAATPVAVTPAVEAPARVNIGLPGSGKKGKIGQAPAVQVTHVKGGKSNPRMDAAETPADNRPWYVQALTRKNRKTGVPFYSVDSKSVMVSGNVAIARSNKWAPALCLINGRRKPIYLNAITLGELAGAHTLLTAFGKANGDYLAQSMTEGEEE